jgi:hypothetical protein
MVPKSTGTGFSVPVLIYFLVQFWVFISRTVTNFDVNIAPGAIFRKKKSENTSVLEGRIFLRKILGFVGKIVLDRRNLTYF